MLISRVAARYAKSLLQLCIQQNTVDAAYQDILLVRDLCKESRDFRIMLKSPVIKPDKKKSIFHQIFADKIGIVTLKFFDIIIRKNREELIYDISESFVSQFKEYREINIIEVESAVELSDANRKQVLEYLKTRSSHEVELVEKVNPDLIGGVIIRMRDLQIDASIKNDLIKLEREFSKDLYTVKY